MSSIRRAIMQKPMIILMAICSATVTIQYINQQQNGAATANSMSRQKRSISSPSPINLEIDSPSQLKSLTRGLNNYENEEEMEMDMEFIQIDSIEDYQGYERKPCVAPVPIDWNAKIVPLYPTSSERFLLPALIWGPMNQVEGLRESIALAIRLNRTLVIPPMYRHFTDTEQPNGICDAEIRVDIPSIRRLISTVSYTSLPAGLTPDSIMVARSLATEGGDAESNEQLPSGSRLSRLKKFEAASGFEIANWKEDQGIDNHNYFKYPLYPQNSTLSSEIRMDYESTNWEALFGNDGKFSILMFPYLTARLEHMHGIGRDIVNYTPRPQFLRDIADEFIQANSFPTTYVTFHYRFDNEDWERSCRRTEKTRNAKRNEKRQKICDILASSSTSGIAEAVASYMVELFSLGQIGKQVAFYVATPPQQEDMISDMVTQAVGMIKTQLGNAISVNAKSTKDASKFFKAAYPNCEFVQSNLHEVFSLFEQDVCSRGKVFIYAPSSSWSGSIRREISATNPTRKMTEKQLEFSLLDILEYYPKDETKLIAAAKQLL